MMFEEDSKEMNGSVEMAEIMDEQEGKLPESQIEENIPDSTMEASNPESMLEGSIPEDMLEGDDSDSSHTPPAPDPIDPAPDLKKVWKARKAELVAGLAVGAFLAFSAGFGCGSVSTNNNRDHFRAEISAGQKPGPGQKGHFGGGFGDGSQNQPGKDDRGHGPGFRGGQGSGDNRPDQGDPPDGNRPRDINGMNLGTAGNGQPGQQPNPSTDNDSQSTDNSGQSKDSSTQSKDNSTQSKDSTSQSQ